MAALGIAAAQVRLPWLVGAFANGDCSRAHLAHPPPPCLRHTAATLQIALAENRRHVPAWMATPTSLSGVGEGWHAIIGVQSAAALCRLTTCPRVFRAAFPANPSCRQASRAWQKQNMSGWPIRGSLDSARPSSTLGHEPDCLGSRDWPILYVLRDHGVRVGCFHSSGFRESPMMMVVPDDLPPTFFLLIVRGPSTCPKTGGFKIS